MVVAGLGDSEMVGALGSSLTVMTNDVLLSNPSRSVARSVSVWSPGLRVVVNVLMPDASAPAVSRTPSMSLSQTIVRSVGASVSSRTSASKSMGSPTLNQSPSLGVKSVRMGALPMLMDTASSQMSPRSSSARITRVCRPG